MSDERTTFHPVDPEASRDPYGALRDLRRRCPVARCHQDGLPPVTLVTRYDDVRRAYRDYRTFGSIGFYPSLAVAAMTPEDQRTIIDIDPPAHTPVRRLNLVALKPAAVDAALPAIEAIADRLVGAIVAAGAAEVVGGLAVPLPAEAIAVILGLPASDAARINEWVATTFSEPAPGGADRSALPADALDAAFDEYLLDHIARRRRGEIDADDALGRMVRFVADDGTSFTDEQLRLHVRTLLFAGNETTTSLISNVVYRLLTVPGAQDQVRADPALLGPMIEECLRYDAPLTQFPRRCMAATELGGVPLEIDEVVSLSMASANRDEDVFGDDAEEFRVDRFLDGQLDHLSFGLGPHYCIGAHLARQTTRLALTVLLDRTTAVELAPDYRYEKVWFFEFWRPRRLDVVLREA